MNSATFITRESIQRKLEKHSVQVELAKRILDYVEKEQVSISYEGAINFIIEYGIDNPMISIKTLIQRAKTMPHQKPWSDMRRRDLYSDYIKGIMAAFLSTNRNDYDTYDRFLVSQMSKYMNDIYTKLLSVPYIYSIEEQPILIQVVKTYKAYSRNFADLLHNPWYCVIVVRYIQSHGAYASDVVDLATVKHFADDFKVILNKYTNSLMSISVRQPSFADNSNLLTPREYVEYMYKKKWIGYSGLELSDKAKKKLISQDQDLFIEYQSPEELKHLFDLKGDCNTYLMFIGESHAITPAQNFGFDPRFGYGDVQLPFNIALVTEEQLVSPDHRRGGCYNWKIPVSVHDFRKAIGNVGFDSNKMATCIQILEHKPVTGYAPKVDLSKAFAYRNQISFNFNAIRLLYQDLDEIAGNMAVPNERARQTYNDVLKIRKYAFGTEVLSNVKSYPSDLRHPYSDYKIWEPLFSASVQELTQDCDAILPYNSYRQIVKTYGYVPDRDIYYYYRFIVRWNMIYMKALDKVSKGKIKEATTAIRLADFIFSRPNFNKLVDDYIQNCKVDWQMSYLNLLFKHAEMDHKSKDEHLALIDFLPEERKKSFVEKKAKEVGDTNYKIRDDRLESLYVNAASPLYHFFKACKDYITLHKGNDYTDSEMAFIKPKNNALFDAIVNEYTIQAQTEGKKGSTVDFARELIFDTDKPYGFDKWDWNYIEKLFGSHIFDKQLLPYITDISKDTNSKNPYCGALSDICNIGMAMRIKQLLESPKPPELIIVSCGSFHALLFMSMFKEKSAKEGFRIHDYKKFTERDLDVETNPDIHVL